MVRQFSDRGIGIIQVEVQEDFPEEEEEADLEAEEASKIKALPRRLLNVVQ